MDFNFTHLSPRFYFFVFLVLSCIYLLWVTYVCYAISAKYAPSASSAPSAPTVYIYGILITGKTPARSAMARHAVDQFFTQTHPLKGLIIINHGTQPVMNDSMQTAHRSHADAIYELMVRKEPHKMTLGDLRNMALNLVPMRPDVAWITWDDDDWRAPNYLELLHTAMQTHRADVVGYARRHECDVTSEFEWVTELKTGFVHCLVRQDPRIRYQSKDTMEDTHLYDLFKELKKNVCVIPSTELPLDRVYYIRTVHASNTSLFVKPNKKKRVENPESAGWRELSLDALPDVRLRIRKICQSILNPVPYP